VGQSHTYTHNTINTRLFDWQLVLQLPAHAGSSLADFSTLKMEAIRSSETSVQSTTSTRRNTPEDGILLKPEIVKPTFLTHTFFQYAGKSYRDNYIPTQIPKLITTYTK
jgi:hypothetical protein